MAYKPILFNTEMVKAIMEGRKTMTRRVIRYTMADVYDFACGLGKWHESYDPHNPPQQLVDMYVRSIDKRPCEPGDILWVRETWCENKNPQSDNFGRYEYRADYTDALCQDLITWRPSIHMPKEAARIFLRVKDVQVEQLQEITEEQAMQEGCSPGTVVITCDPMGVEVDPDEPQDWTAVEDFEYVWNSTIKPADKDRYGWNANPWVWVIEFEKIEKPEDWK